MGNCFFFFFHEVDGDKIIRAYECACDVNFNLFEIVYKKDGKTIENLFYEKTLINANTLLKFYKENKWGYCEKYNF